MPDIPLTTPPHETACSIENAGTQAPYPYSTTHFSKHFTRDLRSDHAGETGAVWIYRGVLRVARDPEVRAFAEQHLVAEQRHLAFFQTWLPKPHQSKLIFLWKISGYGLGAVSALLGKRMLFLTITAVESFVVEHYQRQLDYLAERGTAVERSLTQSLTEFQQDEAHHQQDAVDRIKNDVNASGAWLRLVNTGSRWAAAAARLF